MDDFAQYWQAYPYKQAKADARKAWAQTEKIRPNIEALLGAVESAKQSIQWRKDGGEFIPLPASWLRGERWDDEHEIVIEQPIVRESRAWKLNDAATVAYGRDRGIEARAGESMGDFRARLENV